MSGRTIEIAYCSDGVAMFDFKHLVEETYGSIDFIAICRNFHSIIIRNLPIIDIDQRNTTRRFILLVIETLICIFD